MNFVYKLRYNANVFVLPPLPRVLSSFDSVMKLFDMLVTATSRSGMKITRRRETTSVEETSSRSGFSGFLFLFLRCFIKYITMLTAWLYSLTVEYSQYRQYSTWHSTGLNDVTKLKSCTLFM